MGGSPGEMKRKIHISGRFCGDRQGGGGYPDYSGEAFHLHRSFYRSRGRWESIICFFNKYFSFNAFDILKTTIYAVGQGKNKLCAQATGY